METDKDNMEENRNFLLKKIASVDSEIMRLQDHIRDLLQEAVDLDIQRSGHVDKITMDFMEAYHYAIPAGDKKHKIYPESMFAEGEERYRSPHMEKEADTPDTEQGAVTPAREEETDGEYRYVTYATLPGQKKETVLEGDDLGELFAKWKEMEGMQDPGNRIRNVFVIDTTARSDATRKYEIATGRDVTPVYLKFPEMSGDDTERVTQWLKENGAEYNSKRNMWYVGRQDSARFMENFRKFIRKDTKYYSYMYNADGSMSRFTGNSIGSITKHWQETVQGTSGHGKDVMTAYFYIREKNAVTGQLGEASRYETATGKDVTPVYLSLPHMSRENFARTTRYLKENGAKFNNTKKLWYITRDQDPVRFERFLPKSQARESTVRKLEEGRKEIAEQDPHTRVQKHEEAVR